MKKDRLDRRTFIEGIARSAAVMSALPKDVFGMSAAPRHVIHEAAGQATTPTTQAKPKIKFAVIGINHAHINSQVERGASRRRRAGVGLREGAGPGGGLRQALPAGEASRAARTRSSRTRRSSSCSAPAIPDERAPLGIRVMQHGKDYMADKPGITTLEQLAEVRRVQAQTKRIYSIMYSERLREPRDGQGGRAGEGRRDRTRRADDRARPASHRRPRRGRRGSWTGRSYGGILCDIGVAPGRPVPLSSPARRAPRSSRRRSATCTTRSHPKFEDFGDMMLRGDGGTGYIRVDWFTPDGLATWGDGRLTILGTDGYIEIRKNIDIAGRPGGSHLFLVDQKETRYIDCQGRRAAVRRAARRRRRQPDRDGDAAGALFPRDRAGAEGAAAGAAGHCLSAQIDASRPMTGKPGAASSDRHHRGATS